MMTGCRILLAGILFFFTIPAVSFADSQKDTLDREITHLLDFINHSECEFVRNGESHTGPKAREHIEKKYNYVKKRVDSTENFIKYAASRSSLSRKPYTIQCGEEIITSRVWLTEELERYRQTVSSLLVPVAD